MRNLIILTLSLFMIACGGGSSSTPDAKEKPADYNGIYLSSDAVMLVDIGGTGKVFATDNEGYFYAFDKTAITGNELQLTGVTITNAEGAYFNDASHTVTVSFDDDTANVMTTINGEPFVHSFERQPETVKIADLAGTFTDADSGGTLSIDAAGNFTVNGSCTLSGTLTDTQTFYHRLNGTATGCADPAFEGEYKGMVFSITINGKKHLIGILHNGTYYIAGKLPL